MSFYAVRVGRRPGIYSTWEECKKLVDKFPGAQYKKFAQRDDALFYVSGKSPGSVIKEKDDLEIWTDGSAHLHEKASWAFLFVKAGGDIIHEEVGKIEGSPFTAPRAEVMAVYHALRRYGSLRKDHSAKGDSFRHVTLYSDNLFVVSTLHLPEIPVGRAHEEIFRKIREITKEFPVTFIHVPGHSGNRFNERADHLASGSVLPSCSLMEKGERFPRQDEREHESEHEGPSKGEKEMKKIPSEEIALSPFQGSMKRLDSLIARFCNDEKTLSSNPESNFNNGVERVAKIFALLAQLLPDIEKNKLNETKLELTKHLDEQFSKSATYRFLRPSLMEFIQVYAVQSDPGKCICH